MAEPYYQDDLVTLYHGDCCEHDGWRSADVLVTDPPYGISWQGHSRTTVDGRRASILGDASLESRAGVLEMWGTERPGAMFGSPLIAPPHGTRQVLVWQKPSDAGLLGVVAGFRRDWEPVYLFGPWASIPASRSGIIRSTGTFRQYLAGHPHGKPVGLMEVLIGASRGTVADPFAGSGSTLIAARNLGRKAIGVEIEERYCEIAARRLAQQAFDFGDAA